MSPKVPEGSKGEIKSWLQWLWGLGEWQVKDSNKVGGIYGNDNQKKAELQ